jgi:hypothetical protein
MRSLFRIIFVVCIAGCAAPRSYLHIRSQVNLSADSVVRLESCQGALIEAVPSWNIISSVPESPQLFWRVRRAADSHVELSEWRSIGSSTSSHETSLAKLDIDVITGEFDAVELKLEPNAHAIGTLALTGTLAARGAILSPSRGTTVLIQVPHRSQKTDDVTLKGRLCSPASLAMICAFYGEFIDVGTIARAAYDDAHDIYGNWPRNLQAIHHLTHGRLEARFVRLSTFAELRSLLESGTPVVISIQGSIRGAPYSPTAGHLLVVRGMTAQGDILTVDPAFADSTQANRTYLAEDIAVAWLINRRGSAYVVTRANTP